MNLSRTAGSHLLTRALILFSFLPTRPWRSLGAPPILLLPLSLQACSSALQGKEESLLLPGGPSDLVTPFLEERRTKSETDAVQNKPFHMPEEKNQHISQAWLSQTLIMWMLRPSSCLFPVYGAMRPCYGNLCTNWPRSIGIFWSKAFYPFPDCNLLIAFYKRLESRES